MPSMRVTIRQTPALLIVALAAFMLIKHFLWPHATAFAVAHPDDAPSVASWGDAGERVELDTNAGVLRLRASGPK